MRRTDKEWMGQAVYFGPSNMRDLWPWEIPIEKGRVVEVTAKKYTAIVEMEDGSRRQLDLERGTAQRLYIGLVEDENGEIAQWAALSEQDLWDYREWDILSTQISQEDLVQKADCEGTATSLTLAICRIFYDIMKNQNTSYQNMSCDQCLHLLSKSPTPTGFCQDCIRNGRHKDHWSGEGGDLLPPVGADT